VRVPHQAIIEFVAAATRTIRGHVILEQAEEMVKQFTILCPNEAIVHDAHLWAYAEHYGMAEILTEDLQHDRLYGTVRIVNPFIKRGALFGFGAHRSQPFS
jgi:predicted nucleic acid-binding protein